MRTTPLAPYDIEVEPSEPKTRWSEALASAALGTRATVAASRVPAVRTGNARVVVVRMVCFS